MLSQKTINLTLVVSQVIFTTAAKLVGRWHNIAMIFQMVILGSVHTSLVMGQNTACNIIALVTLLNGQHKGIEKIVESEASKATAKDNYAAKKKKLQEFIEKQTLKNIVLKSYRKDVESIGGVAWTKSIVEMKKDFTQDHGVTILQTMHNDTDLGKVVANHLSGSSIITTVALKQAATAAARPVCVVASGTMFCVVNTIIGCKMAYMATKGQGRLGHSTTQSSCMGNHDPVS